MSIKITRRHGVGNLVILAAYFDIEGYEARVVETAFQTYSFLLPRNCKVSGSEFATAIEDYCTVKPWPEEIEEGTELPLLPPASALSKQTQEMIRCLKLLDNWAVGEVANG